MNIKLSESDQEMIDRFDDSLTDITKSSEEIRELAVSVGIMVSSHLTCKRIFLDAAKGTEFEGLEFLK